MIYIVNWKQGKTFHDVCVERYTVFYFCTRFQRTIDLFEKVATDLAVVCGASLGWCDLDTTCIVYGECVHPLGVYIIFWKLVEVGLWAESFSRSSSVRLSWSSLSEWWKIRFDLLWADKSAIWRLGLVSSSLAQGRFGVGQYRVPRFHAPNGASFGEWIRIFVWVPFDDWKCVQTGIEI